jgi:hypothetical protein
LGTTPPLRPMRSCRRASPSGGRPQQARRGARLLLN